MVLRLPVVPSPAGLLAWTDGARDATATQGAALRDLLSLLRLVAWAGLGIALATVLVLALARAARRGAELGIHRAVGGSIRTVRLSLLIEGGVVSLGLVLLGVTIGYAALRVSLDSWPESAAPARFVPGIVGLLVAGGAVTLGALLSLRFAGQRHLVHPGDGSVSLKIPAVQLGVSLAVLTAGAVVLERAGALAARGFRAADNSGVILQIDSGIPDPAQRASRYSQLMQRLARERAPGASLASPGYHLGLGTVDYVRTACGNCFTAGVWVPWHGFEAVHHFVSPASFAARGTRLVAGRLFAHADTWTAGRVAIVNQHLAGQHFEAGDAIGREIFLSTGVPRKAYQVIGVVADRPSTALGGAAQPRETVYLSALQHPPSVAEFLIGSSDAPASVPIVETFREVLGPQIKLQSVADVPEHTARASRPLAWFGAWFAVAGAVALGIGVAGTLAVMVMWVRSHAPELALRRALGATRSRITAVVLLQVLRVVAGGVVFGAACFVLLLWIPMSSIVANLPAWNPRLMGILAVPLAVAAVAGVLGAVRRVNAVQFGSLLR